MKETYDLADEKSQQSGARGKKHCDSAILQPGDKVMVRNLKESGDPGKSSANWENKVHVDLE